MGLKEDIKQSRSFRNEYHKASVNLIYTGKWVINFHNELLNDYGLTLQQYNILRILKGHHPKPTTVKLITERMLDKASDASRIVEVLRKKDLVERNLNSIDRRKVDVMITEKGEQILEEIEAKSDIMDNFLCNLDLHEIDLLNTLLDKARKS
jgi:MarR family transcriptional regulator, multiple gene regulator MgrA